MPKPFTAKKYAREEFEKALKENDTIREVLLSLGLCGSGGNYKTFYGIAKRLGIDVSEFRSQSKYDRVKSHQVTIKDDDIKMAVKNHYSFQSVIKHFELNINSGTNNRWIREKIRTLGIDISHFTGQGHLKGKTHNWSKSIPLKDILVIDSDYQSTDRLKKRLWKEEMLKRECYECGLQETWNGKPISLQMDHINGCNTDNRIENLRILCPNCHSQTDTFCSKKRRVSYNCVVCNKKLAGERQTGMCRECLNIKQSAKPKSIHNPGNKSIKNSKCIECSTPINISSVVCKNCYNNNRAKHTNVPRKTKIVWPSDQQLLAMLEVSNFWQVGKTLGVSDNAIRKHLKRNGLIQ